MSDAAPRLYARSVAEQRVHLCFCGVGDKQRALDKVCDVLCQHHGASVVRVCVPALANLRQTRRGASSLTLTLLRSVAMLAAHEAAPHDPADPPPSPAAVLAMGRDALRALLRAQCARLAAARPRALLVLALDGADHDLVDTSRGAADALVFLAALPAVALLATADTLRGDALRRVLWTFVRADTFVPHPPWKLSSRAIPDPACAPATTTSTPTPAAPDDVPAPATDGCGAGEDGAPEQLGHLSRVQVRLLRLVDRLCAQDEELYAQQQQQQQQQQQGARGGAVRRRRGRVDTQSVKLAAKAGGLFHSGARAEENLTDLVRAGLVVQCADSALRGVAFWQTTDIGERAVLHLEREEALQRQRSRAEEASGSESSSSASSSAASMSDSDGEGAAE